MNSSDAVITAVIIQVFTLLGIVIVQVFAWITAKERRRQDLEDRAAVVAAAKAATNAARQAALNATHAMTVVHSAVVEVGQKADLAYTEANQANLKIQSVQDAITTALNMPAKVITQTGLNEEQAHE